MATPTPSVSEYFQLEQAGKISYADDYANVQKSLESSKTSYVNQLKENAEEIKEMYDEVDKKLGLFTSGQSDLEFGNPGVNWDDTWLESKTEYADLSRKLAAGVGTGADRARISALDALVDSTPGNISNLTLLAQSAAEARQNPGKMGGIDMTSNSKETLLAMEILNGNAIGSKKLVTDLKSNPPNQRWEVYDADGKLLWDRSTADIEQMLEKGGSGGVTRIPAETPTMQNNVATLRLPGKDGKPGEINNDFYETGEDDRPIEKTRVLTSPDGSKKIETYYELDMNKIRASISNNITAGAKGLSDSDKEGAIALYNSVLGPGQTDPQTGEEIEFVPIDSKNFVWDDEIQKKYNGAYVNYNLNNFLKRDRQISIVPYTEPVEKPKPNRGGGSGTPISPRALQIRGELYKLINPEGLDYDNYNEVINEQPLEATPIEIVDLLKGYGANDIFTLDQVLADEGSLKNGLEPRDKKELIFVYKNGELLPIKAFTKNPSMKGLIEGYRNVLKESKASAADQKAWNDATASFYNRPSLPTAKKSVKF